MSAVIKRDRYPGAAALALPDIEREAAAILSRAREEGQRIIAAAREQSRGDVVRAVAEGRKRGQEEGRREGREHALREARTRALEEQRTRLSQLAAALTSAADEYDAARHRLFSEAETGLVRLALAIARRVCKRVAAVDPGVALESVRAVLALTDRAGDIELHLSPAQCDALTQEIEELARHMGRARHVRVVADPVVPAGGCRAVGAAVEADASLDVQLDRIAELLCPPSSETSPGTATRADGQTLAEPATNGGTE